MKIRQFFKRLAAVLFWIAVWEILSLAIGEEILIASPLATFKRLCELVLTGSFWKSVLLSSGKILLGLSLSVPASFLLALASYRSPFVRDLMKPLVSFLKSVPVASFIILALVFVSSAYLSTLISFMIAFPVLYLNLLEGFSSRDEQLIEMARVFRVRRGKVFLSIELPACLPYFASALAIASGLAWKSGIAAEVIGIPQGSIGEALYRAKVYLLTGDLFAWTFVIVLLNFLTEKLLRLLLRPLSRRSK